MKITVVGAGNVGATVADCIARMDIVSEVVLLDIVEGMPQGKALDILESAPIHGFDTLVSGTNDYADTAGSDVCVITAGLARRPGMSRDDLLTKNAGIVRSVTSQLVAESPDTILLVVSNPLDVMTYVAHETSGFDAQKVFGMAGILDTARYRTFIKLELDVSVRDIQAVLMGGHGDTMVPLPRYTTVCGIPLPQLLPADRIEAIVERTKMGGGEIVKLEGTSAWYAPGAAAAEMVEAIVKDSKRVLPCAVWLSGQYGLDGLFMGAPVKLGRRGIEEIVELELNEEEKALLDSSAEHVLGTIERFRAMEAAS